MRKGITAAAMILLTACTVCGCGAKDTGEKNEYVQISQEEAKRCMDEESGFVILDVRTEEEYAQIHIPGAVLIPDYEIQERAEEELHDKDQLILVYCRSGNRSKKAAQTLAELGYTNVREFGGINSWPYETE